VLSTSTDVLIVGSQLQVALGRVVRRLRQGHVPGDLTLSELSALARLERGGPATPGELAGDERVRPQAMGVTLAGLTERALVSRSADPADGRRVLMSITDAGRQLVVDRRGAKAERMAAALAGTFTPAEIRRLAEAVPLIERLADAL
jgi:DNA-binding MarR family transcriptional regulator